MASILAADDEEDLRKLLRAALSRRGHAVVEASSGAESLRRLTAETAPPAVKESLSTPLEGPAGLGGWGGGRAG